MDILRRVTKPQVLKSLSDAELSALCQEIRDYLVESVSKTGGHLGPNLGVVETTVAIHRVSIHRETRLFGTLDTKATYTSC